MWQVLLGIYLVVSVLSGILLWSSLVLAKKSDRNTETRLRPSTDLIVGGKDGQRAKKVSGVLN